VANPKNPTTVRDQRRMQGVLFYRDCCDKGARKSDHEASVHECEPCILLPMVVEGCVGEVSVDSVVVCDFGGELTSSWSKEVGEVEVTHGCCCLTVGDENVSGSWGLSSLGEAFSLPDSKIRRCRRGAWRLTYVRRFFGFDLSAVNLVQSHAPSA
jgi:hypothetical protein